MHFKVILTFAFLSAISLGEQPFYNETTGLYLERPVNETINFICGSFMRLPFGTGSSNTVGNGSPNSCGVCSNPSTNSICARSFSYETPIFYFIVTYGQPPHITMKQENPAYLDSMECLKGFRKLVQHEGSGYTHWPWTF